MLTPCMLAPCMLICLWILLSCYFGADLLFLMSLDPWTGDWIWCTWLPCFVQDSPCRWRTVSQVQSKDWTCSCPAYVEQTVYDAAAELWYPQLTTLICRAWQRLLLCMHTHRNDKKMEIRGIAAMEKKTCSTLTQPTVLSYACNQGLTLHIGRTCGTCYLAKPAAWWCRCL